MNASEAREDFAGVPRTPLVCRFTTCRFIMSRGGDNVGKEKSGEIPNMNANRKVSVFCLQVIDNNYQKNRVNASTICAIMYNSKKRKN